MSQIRPLTDHSGIWEVSQLDQPKHYRDLSALVEVGRQERAIHLDIRIEGARAADPSEVSTHMNRTRANGSTVSRPPGRARPRAAGTSLRTRRTAAGESC